MSITPINVVLCDSFTRASDELAVRPAWTRVGIDRWVHDTDEYRIITDANRLRGHRVAKTVLVYPVSEYLLEMSVQRRANRDD